MPTFPSTAAFPASASFPAATFPFGGLTLINTQKLSLPANTPVGTEVMVSDWEAAGLAGPHQRLNAPSTAVAGIFVDESGNGPGFFFSSGTINGKTSYAIPTTNDVFGSPVATGTISWSGTRWEAYFYEELFIVSSSDVATPDLATGWTHNGDPWTNPIRSFTQGELRAGLTAVYPVTNAFFTAGTYILRASSWVYYSRPVYVPPTIVDSEVPDYVPNGSGALVIVADDWADRAAHLWTASVAFPWEGSDDNPAWPTITRNDVASEANWEVLP
jgi:hypothetical protein